MTRSVDPSIKAVLFDFGGVILTSPFDAFAEYEARNSLPAGLIRSINSTNPDSNAWAEFERGDVDRAGFVSRFDAEARWRCSTTSSSPAESVFANPSPGSMRSL